MIFYLERKSYNIDAKASDHNGTSVVINKSLTIGNKQYQLRSIIYHKGADENMYGHFTCNCLVDCRPFVSGRRSKDYAQWFEFDEDKPIPLTEDDAISSDEVKKGCSLLFYQQRDKKIEVIKGHESQWGRTDNGSFSIIPQEMRHIGDNCFANVVFQSLAFLDFRDEADHYMHSTSTWANLAKKEQSKSFPSNLIYHSGFIDMFLTKIFRDFQAVGD